MSAALKQRFITEAATQDLLRVAETDDVDELRRVLRSVVDVNVRNKHGMTALMRAAYHGHEGMVRVLLEHGADPNLMRNDRFTALALAAFFGHTETVRMLIEHGAKTEVVTRCGTSAHMWATARTFKEAARCLESPPRRVPTPIRPPAPSPPAPARAPARAADPTPAPMVKTLKEPPEIWDLVHEVPRGFNARSAFMARLRSMNRWVAVSVLTGVLLIVAGGVGLLMMRSSQASGVQAEVPLRQTSDQAIPVQSVETPVSEASTSVSEPEVSEAPTIVSTDQPRRTTSRQFKPRAADTQIVVQESPVTADPIPATVATPQFEKPKATEADPRVRPSVPLSPQVITPAQSSKPKPKVIQWP